MERRAKIVATLGPASQSETILARLIHAGVDIVRLNFSHGTHDEHASNLARLRQMAGKAIKPVCILQDLQGPKIRTGEIGGGGIELVAGQEITLVASPAGGRGVEISVDFPHLASSLSPGGRILLDDGNLELQVLETKGSSVRSQVIVGGLLKSHKGINLPGARLDIPALTEKDENDLAFGLREGVDAVALSFVRSGKDIIDLREKITALAPHCSSVPIIAKMEKPEALDHLEEIVQAADGVMVARGDLGVEMSPQEVPIAQKCIIQCANRYGKVVITATQMLDSMIHNPRPTRAEASDVANAVFDGTDALMLSGETAIGKYPVEAVEMMHAIICQAEAHGDEWGQSQPIVEPASEQDDTYYMTQAAHALARDRNVAAIAIFTQSGRSALAMSKSRPCVPILAFTPNIQTYTRLGMYWGVTPYLVSHADTVEAMLSAVEATMMATGSIKPGQQVVLICGFPVGESRPTNLALLHTVG